MKVFLIEGMNRFKTYNSLHSITNIKMTEESALRVSIQLEWQGIIIL